LLKDIIYSINKMGDTNTVYEEAVSQMNVVYKWSPAVVEDSITTSRGTLLEMVRRPNWGLSCYMDNSIQSCEADEGTYHDALTRKAMSYANGAKRVCIIGGGEGATARNVLSWPGVERVDMIEWDSDVIDLFKAKYPQWSRGAWDDPRLHIEIADAFAVCEEERVYDVVIVDLFDPTKDDLEKWSTLVRKVTAWATRSVVVYSGMSTIFDSEPVYQDTFNIMASFDKFHIVERYNQFVPSFVGEAVFVFGGTRGYPFIEESIAPESSAESAPESSAESAPESSAESAPESSAESAPESSAEPVPEESI
jgi:spermidine synthase